MAAAQAITTEQRAVLLKEMSQALDYVIYGKDAVKSSAHSFKNSNQSFERCGRVSGLNVFPFLMFILQVLVLF